jgi:hypothetical protein
VKLCGAEEDVPQGESSAEVAAATTGGTQSVVGSMETWRDEDMVAEPSVADACVGVRHAAEEPEAKDEEWELERGHADDEADADEPDVGDGVFEDVRSVIGPEGQLVFGMMQRVDTVPPTVTVREPMAPVVGEIEDGKAADEDDDGPCTEEWENSGERGGRYGVSAEESVDTGVQPVVFEVGDEREEDDADEEGVRYVSRDGVAFWPTGEWPEAFERGTDEEGNAELGDTACGEEEPKRNRMTVVLQANSCQKRLNGSENASDARCARCSGEKCPCHVVPPRSTAITLASSLGTFEMFAGNNRISAGNGPPLDLPLWL